MSQGSRGSDERKSIYLSFIAALVVLVSPSLALALSINLSVVRFYLGP